MRHNEEGRQCATTLHAQRQGNQAVAGSNDTQREGPVKPGPRRQRGPSEGEGGLRQAGTKQTKNQNRINNRGTTPTVALQIAKTMGKTTNSRTLTSGKGGRGVVSSVLRQGITVTSSSMIVRHRVRERALMQWASWCEEALV